MLKTVLVPLDGSRLAEGALPIATTLAQALHGQLLLVQAVRASGLAGSSLAELQARLTADALAYLEPLAAQLRDQGLTVHTSASPELAEDGILAEAEARDADLIVMTTHGRSGLGRWLYGSVAESVLARSPIPVLLVRAARDVAPPLAASPRILVPLDGSFFAEAALPPAVELARALHATLVLLRVVLAGPVRQAGRATGREAVAEPSDSSVAHAASYLAAQAEALRREGLTVVTAQRLGSPAAAILEEAATAALIVMSTHGRTGLPRLLAGSVALTVLRQTVTPILLVRPHGLNGEMPPIEIFETSRP